MSRVRNWASLETEVQFGSARSLKSGELPLSVCNKVSIEIGAGKESEVSDLGLVKVVLFVMLMTAYRAETSTSEACRRR